MNKNIGTLDRGLRLIGGAGLMASAALAPLPLWLRLGVLAASGAYVLFTALAGTCIGYTLMGRSTCPLPKDR